ncbi:uncharacterized protein DUF1837 [Mucilaginibacter oryzae]|uniref:Uncharacterized protein DUF1837 n=1 Tax=Mucilaginibacter oryzae TaxID=468058 RepID=A0A316GSV9_9SPHI|nr:Hachiman antiphage defense system protein HamA [Mucilaginibacter oryzae]PWK64903.1 uncharacterized protein DUF1837 [Mucilaginibacter oryzae]
MTFKVLIDDAFSVICSDETLTPIDKKRVLSLANDFEDCKWRFEKFQNFIWDNIAETALSSREGDALINNPHSSIKESAKKLRLTDKVDDISSGSELAEILLYGIMKHYYNALPVVPKYTISKTHEITLKELIASILLLMIKTLQFGLAKQDFTTVLKIQD